MTLLNTLLGRKRPRTLDSHQLRELLFDALKAGNRRVFEDLCQKHSDAILRAFPDWNTVPEVLRSNVQEAQGYIQRLLSIAMFFLKSFGRSELLAECVGPAESNPLLHWQTALGRADELMAGLSFGEALKILEELLEQIREAKPLSAGRWSVPANAPLKVDSISFSGIISGRIGDCHFQLGEPERARQAIETALERSRLDGDDDGIIAHLGNLYEIYRYLGASEGAASYAMQSASHLEQLGRLQESAWWHRKAAVVRRGEPLNRIKVRVEGEDYEIDELAGMEIASAQFRFERNRPGLRCARAFVEEGARLAGRNLFDEALEAFRRAAKADRYDPDPHYMSGRTLLHAKRYSEAIESFARAESLAPGWFNCRADMWLAQQLATERIDYTTFLVLRELEDGTSSPEQKLRLAVRALDETPNLAPIYLFYGKNLIETGKPKQAEAAYRAGLQCADEPDVETRLLVNLAFLIQGPSKQESQRLLRRAVDLNGNLTSAAMARLVLNAGRIQ